MSNQIINLISNVLKGYKVPVSYRTIEQEINTHPEYPSIQSISNALDSWRVKNVVMELTLEKLRALDVPVIAHLKQGEFVWVTQVTESEVYYTSASGKEKVKSLDRFEKEWSGVALAITEIDGAGEPDFKDKRRKEIKENTFKWLIIGGFIVLFPLLTFFAWIIDAGISLLPKALLLISNVTGCFIGYLLIRQEKRQTDALSAKFCKVG